MLEQDGFIGIRFGQSLEIAHQLMTSKGFKFVGRGKAEAPIGRVVYSGRYMERDAKVQLDFLRNGFHRLRMEIEANDIETAKACKQDLSRKYGPSERLTRNRQACADDSPQDPCFDMWALDDDTSLILDIAGTNDRTMIIMEFFRIL